MRKLVNLFLGAVAFMTRLPVPRHVNGGPDALSSSAVFFPLVGLLVSAVPIILNHVLSRFLSRDVLVVIVLVFLVAIATRFTGGAEVGRLISVLLLGSVPVAIYGFLQGAWPFGLVELVWSGVAFHRWWHRRQTN